MRTVTERLAAAARAQRRSAAGAGTPERGIAYCTVTLFLRRGGVVGIDDARHQRVAHDVLRGELGEGDAADVGEDAPHFYQPAFLAAREVDLRDVAVHHRLGAEADTREEHLHLLGRGVLRFVEDDEGVVERAAAHVGERRELDRAALEKLAGLLEAHEVEKRVVERAQIWIDLLREIARQETQSLARFDGRAREHDALHLVSLERVDRAGHGQVGLPGTRGPDAEGEVVRQDVLYVLHLVRRAPMQIGAAREELRALGRRRRGAGSLQQLGEAELHIVECQLAGGAIIEMLERLHGTLRLLAAHGELGAATGDRHVERRLDLAQVCIERAAQARQALIVPRVEGKLGGPRPYRGSSPRRVWGGPAVVGTSEEGAVGSSPPGKLTMRLLPVR